MVDLVVRQGGSVFPDGKNWALQLRYHEASGETEYYPVARVTKEMAKEILNAGAPFALYEDPRS
jgi:hypothetical protein